IELGERRRFLGILVSETERLSRLVNQVLDLAKIESGHADWRTEEVRLQEVIDQAVAATGQLVADRGAQVSLELCEQPATVWADRDRLVQVLVNLLSNAAKFAPREGGRVEIRLAAAGDDWRVCVSDNGPGIPEAERRLVFEKFRQSASGGEKPVGTGLGLPICRQIVENFGGSIWVADGAGIGATLCFDLPGRASAPGKPHSQNEVETPA
ncbi:MAG: HAMP domain-containing sensor histidine kinase, partial [Chromatiaceae bacterium]